jgi:hypothetical protein
MNKFKDDFKSILIVLILILIVFSIFLYSFIRSESIKCISNPYIYATHKLNEGLGQTKCDCSTQTNDSIIFFHFNGSWLWGNNIKSINNMDNLQFNITSMKGG